MASATRTRPRAAAGGPDPFRWLFRLLTSVRFALLQLAVLSLLSLVGVLVPQAPDEIRLNPPSFTAWIEFQRGKYGPLTDLMRQLNLFEFYRSIWFNGMLAFLMVSVTVCTANRFTPVWRTVRHPLRRVNDRYFETAHARASFPTPADPAQVERVLRRKHFKVETVAEREGVRYLFADRFSWSALATFATHLSLLLFLAGGIVSKLWGFQTYILIGEGGSQPVFPVLHANQMQVQNLDSIEGRDAEGRINDYRTWIVVNKDGREQCRGDITVNGPLRCNGYTFHQATYTPDAAALQVRDRRGGEVVYAESPLLQARPGAPAPRLVVRDAAGAVVLDEWFTLAPISQDTLAQIFPMPDSGRLFAVSGKLDLSGKDWQLNVVAVPRTNEPTDVPIRLALRAGERAGAGGYTFELAELRGNPYQVVQGVPGMERAALLQIARGPDGGEQLDVQNMGTRDADLTRFQLIPGIPVSAGDYEYTFQGRREHTGVLVKRDPGSWFIWTATTLLIGGLMVTFYAPRRRLWVKITPDQTTLAGLAERQAHLGEELAALGDEISLPCPCPG